MLNAPTGTVRTVGVLMNVSTTATVLPGETAAVSGASLQFGIEPAVIVQPIFVSNPFTYT